MSSVQLKAISKSYDGVSVLKNVNLSVDEGEFVTILGGSGSGKTTCLRMIAGFIAPDAGQILIGDRDVASLPVWSRNIGMVFQSYALFPHMTVADNVAYGLKCRGVPAAQIQARVQDALRLVQLEDFAKRYPRQLSGGQRQRVALARAIVIEPSVLILDEPLGALDQKLREELEVEIKNIQQQLAITMIFVTHDQNEALTMSDKVVLLRDGEVVQADTPLNLYRQPRNLYVANFVGSMNLLEGIVCEQAADGGRHVVKLAGAEPRWIEVVGRPLENFFVGERCVVGFRPADAVFCAPDDARSVVAKVSKVDFAGDNWIVRCVGPADQAIVVHHSAQSAPPVVGAEMSLRWSGARSALMKVQ